MHVDVVHVCYLQTCLPVEQGHCRLSADPEAFVYNCKSSTRVWNHFSVFPTGDASGWGGTSIISASDASTRVKLHPSRGGADAVERPHSLHHHIPSPLIGERTATSNAGRLLFAA